MVPLLFLSGHDDAAVPTHVEQPYSSHTETPLMPMRSTTFDPYKD